MKYKTSVMIDTDLRVWALANKVTVSDVLNTALRQMSARGTTLQDLYNRQEELSTSLQSLRAELDMVVHQIKEAEGAAAQQEAVERVEREKKERAAHEGRVLWSSGSGTDLQWYCVGPTFCALCKKQVEEGTYFTKMAKRDAYAGLACASCASSLRRVNYGGNAYDVRVSPAAPTGSIPISQLELGGMV